jgi:uncharacterized membrane protein
MLASVVSLIRYVHHAGQSRRAAALIDLVGDRSRLLIDVFYPPGPRDDGTAGDGDPTCIAAPEPGVLFRVDRPALVAAARRAGCVLELVPVIGDFVAAGAPLFRVHPRSDDGPGRLVPAAVTRRVGVGAERVHDEDPAYGLRKLVDIAERSIAQPFNRLQDLLRQLASRPFPSGRHSDEQGHLRLVERTLSWDGYVRLAFDEIRLAGVGTPQVTRRMSAALHDLRTVAPPDRQAALDRQLDLLASAVQRSYRDEDDVRAALVPDAQGIGSGADVTTSARREGSGQDG